MELGPCAAHPPTPRLSDRAPSDPAARAARQAPLKRDQGSACASRQGYRQSRAPLKPGDRTPTQPSTDPSGPAPIVLTRMSEPLHSVRVSNAELATVREAMRELHRLLAQRDRGELEKVVLTQRNQMRAVLITLERYNQLVEQHAAAGPVKRPGTAANGRGRDSEEGPLDASPAWRNPGR